jgi:hypothetical protein
MPLRPPRAAVRARHNPDPSLSLWEYVDAEFAEALEALGLRSHDDYGAVVITFPSGGSTVISGQIRLSGYDNGRMIHIRAKTDEADGLSEKAWRSEALPALERAAEATGNVVDATFYPRGMGKRPRTAVIVPSWFPRQSVIVAAFSGTKRRVTAAPTMAENRFRVPQEYRKQIGALLQQAAKTEDLATYLQAKELAAAVAE